MDTMSIGPASSPSTTENQRRTQHGASARPSGILGSQSFVPHTKRDETGLNVLTMNPPPPSPLQISPNTALPKATLGRSLIITTSITISCNVMREMRMCLWILPDRGE
ncbi:hypothetical protein AC578_10166 [Pseudocercospora eumusae]|uniref:Uncharacterized protein n=1 Tax=Pseudocercospora eumusae TaxID=321146 RepID=A0A139HZ03_9PEZI|nr:hypothetical protein AC578_10166 [Pseudocercospora eumusae]